MSDCKFCQGIPHIPECPLDAKDREIEKLHVDYSRGLYTPTKEHRLRILETQNHELTSHLAACREALEQIVKMEGPYRIDYCEHAKEVIALNQNIAKEALSRLDGRAE